MPGKTPPTQPLTVGHIPQSWPSPQGSPNQSLQIPGLLEVVPPGSAHSYYPGALSPSEVTVTFWQQDHYTPEGNLSKILGPGS